MASSPVPESVTIVGGSLAGLMHALVFLSLPTPPRIRILERAPTSLLHNQGAGIVAGPDARQFFDQYIRPGREIVVKSGSRHYLDHAGDILPESVEGRAQYSACFDDRSALVGVMLTLNSVISWDLIYHLLRWRVDGLDSEYVQGLQADDRPKVQYENGCTITNIEDAGDKGVKITWTEKDQGEKTAVSDVVIAADGASSTVRRLLEPSVQRKYVRTLSRTLNLISS